jgi:hypothetical protein
MRLFVFDARYFSDCTFDKPKEFQNRLQLLAAFPKPHSFLRGLEKEAGYLTSELTKLFEQG